MIPPLPALSCTAPPPGLVKHKHRETINKGNVGRMLRRGVPRRKRAPGKCSLSLSLFSLFHTDLGSVWLAEGETAVAVRQPGLFTGHHRCRNPWRKDRKAETATLDPSRMHHLRLPTLLDIAPSCLGYLFRLIAGILENRGNRQRPNRARDDSL